MKGITGNDEVRRAGAVGQGSAWQPLAGWQVIAVVVFGVLILYLGNTGERWIPVLDSANLAFHEAGHPLFWLLNSRLGVYGGTLGQLALPLLVAASFWRRGDAFATSFALLWLFQNFFNIALMHARRCCRWSAAITTGPRSSRAGRCFISIPAWPHWSVCLGGLAFFSSVVRWRESGGGGAARAPKTELRMPL